MDRRDATEWLVDVRITIGCVKKYQTCGEEGWLCVVGVESFSFARGWRVGAICVSQVAVVIVVELLVELVLVLHQMTTR